MNDLGSFQANDRSLVVLFPVTKRTYTGTILPFNCSLDSFKKILLKYLKSELEYSIYLSKAQVDPCGL